MFRFRAFFLSHSVCSCQRHSVPTILFPALISQVFLQPLEKHPHMIAVCQSVMGWEEKGISTRPSFLMYLPKLIFGLQSTPSSLIVRTKWV